MSYERIFFLIINNSYHDNRLMITSETLSLLTARTTEHKCKNNNVTQINYLYDMYIRKQSKVVIIIHHYIC